MFTLFIFLAFLSLIFINRHASGSGSGSGSYSGGLTWSIVLRCDDHTGIFTCDGCARDPYFYVPAETQSYVIKLSCSIKKPVKIVDYCDFPLQNVNRYI